MRNKASFRINDQTVHLSCVGQPAFRKEQDIPTPPTVEDAEVDFLRED